MDKKNRSTVVQKRAPKLAFLFLFFLLLVLIFLFKVLIVIQSDRRLPSQFSIYKDRSLRGKIISKDNYVLCDSYKLYKASVNAKSIVPEKKELFIKLFSIYSGIEEERIRAAFYTKQKKPKHGIITLSNRLNITQATALRQLSHKLIKLGVFRSIRTKSGVAILYGLDVVEIGEKRRFRAKDILEPIIGYVAKSYEGDYVRPVGKKGLEKAYEKHLRSKKDGFFKGKRDVTGDIIHNKDSIASQRVDGLNVHLHIPIALQRRMELMVDGMKRSLDADEVMVGVMESKSGKIIALATSNRYNPAFIGQDDIDDLVIKFCEYPYEPGSVIKPIALAIALDEGVVTPHTRFETYNGVMKLSRRHTIKDDHPFASLDSKGIIIHSSNIGISQIAWKLSAKEFREGLLRFGFSRPSGVDLDRDLPGKVMKLETLENRVYRANTSYGYSMTATFLQLLKAYNVFNNDGKMVIPRLAEKLSDSEGGIYMPRYDNRPKLVISQKSASQIKSILTQVVSKGTGKKANYPGLEIGGKTGTAHIYKHGQGYVREYHSSFFGFANDNHGNRYTIGALVIRAKKWRKYFASQSAVPTFKKAVTILAKLGYLKPDANATKQVDEDLYGKESFKELHKQDKGHDINTLFKEIAPKKRTPKKAIKPKRNNGIKKKPKTLSKKRKTTPSSPHRKSTKPTNQSAVELFEDLF